MSGVETIPEPCTPSSHCDGTLRRVRWCAIVLVAIGVVLRFAGLGSKPFWFDEIHTGLAISGATKRGVQKTVFDGQERTRQDVLAYQFPRRDRSVINTVKVLARNEPKHPPLYFVLARGWVQAFGATVTTLRGLSVFLGLLSLPLVYLVCRELVEEPVAAWVAVGLVAISPLHLIYAQEARQYMLWLVMLLLANWSLLCAMRHARDGGGAGIGWFLLYAMMLTLAMFSHLLTVFVAAAHATYVVVVERFRLTRVTVTAAASILIACAAILPWATIAWSDSFHHRGFVSWAGGPITTIQWMVRLINRWSSVVADLYPLRQLPYHLPVVLALIPVVAATACAIWGMRCAPRRARLFLFTSAAVFLAPFVAADFVMAASRATVVRYQFP